MPYSCHAQLHPGREANLVAILMEFIKKRAVHKTH
jgi:hypothetical protein